MLTNPLGKGKAAAESTPATAPEGKKGCCSKEAIDTYGMVADDKRKCRDVFCCTLFV